MRTPVRWRALVAGGLLAGAANVILGLLAAALWAGDALQAAMDALGVTVRANAAVFVSHVAQRLAFGIVVVWLYAAMRPGVPSRRAAVAAAILTGWFLLYGSFAWTNIAWGWLPTSLMLMTAAWGLVELGVTTVVGVWLYERIAAS